MFNYPFPPTDCSAETLFPDTINHPYFEQEPDYYAEVDLGFGILKKPVWAITFDPIEKNERQPDGSIDYDYYICLCKWLDGSPITFRYRKEQVHASDNTWHG